LNACGLRGTHAAKGSIQGLSGLRLLLSGLARFFLRLTIRLNLPRTASAVANVLKLCAEDAEAIHKVTLPAILGEEVLHTSQQALSRGLRRHAGQGVQLGLELIEDTHQSLA
jgi:hypothetical protein